MRLTAMFLLLATTASAQTLRLPGQPARLWPGNAECAGPAINVKCPPYNATGNGVTDDTAALQAAITAASAAGKIIYIPAGTYAFGATLTRPGVVRLTGAGVTATTLKYTGSGTAISVPTPGTRIYNGGITDLTVFTTTGAVGIDLDSVSTAHFRNLAVTGFSDKSIWIHSSIGGGAVYNRFYDVQVTCPAMPNSATGFLIGASGSNATSLFGTRTNLCNTGYLIEDSNDTTLDSAQAEAGGTGFAITASSSGLSEWNRCFGCRAEGNTLGVSVGTNVGNWTMVGEYLTGNTTNITDNGTTTRRSNSQLYLQTNGVQSAVNVLAPGFSLTSGTGSLLAATNSSAHIRSNIPDSAGNVGVWIGNNPTLTNATTRIVGFSADTPVTHAVPAAYIRKDGAYEFASGPILNLNPVAFASLGTPENGSVVYCSDCTIANPCAGGGTGALAKRLNGAWVCN